jgi:hypothetical protein
LCSQFDSKILPVTKAAGAEATKMVLTVFLSLPVDGAHHALIIRNNFWLWSPERESPIKALMERMEMLKKARPAIL